MVFTPILIGSVVGGLVLAVIIKLLFNKIAGHRGLDFSDLGEFFGIFIACTLIILLIVGAATCESCMGSCIQ